MDMMMNLLAKTGGFWNAWPIIRIVALVIMAICAIFIILVVLFQPANSNGVSALGGQTEMFLSKNKSKTFEHRMRVLTIIAGVTMAVLCVVFAIIEVVGA